MLLTVYFDEYLIEVPFVASTRASSRSSLAKVCEAAFLAGYIAARSDSVKYYKNIFRLFINEDSSYEPTEEDDPANLMIAHFKRLGEETAKENIWFPDDVIKDDSYYLTLAQTLGQYMERSDSKMALSKLRFEYELTHGDFERVRLLELAIYEEARRKRDQADAP